jgi:SAM-dependent methyltransferase
MNLKKYYENEFAYTEPQKFLDYERNRALARLFTSYLKSGMKFLDLGCNDGVICEYFAKRGLNVTGMDISKRALDFARQRGIENLIVGDCENPLPFASSQFDAVFWGDNVEHLFSPLNTLKEIHRVLKPEGVLILSTPNMGWIINRIYYLLFGTVRRTEGHRNPPWRWEHIRFFNKKIIRAFLNEGGFEMVQFSSCDRRLAFDFLARFWPSMFGSIMLVCSMKK